MCAHYEAVPPGIDFRHFNIEWASPELSDLPAELYPGRRGMVLRLRDGAPGLDVLTWTLVPSWSKTGEVRDHRPCFNARRETADSLPTFRAAFRHRRCLVPAQAFVEHPVVGGRKVRHRVSSADGAPLMFAGLWEHWTARDRSSELWSYTILTAEPHPGLRWLHHRMPVALTPEGQAMWMDPETPAPAAKQLLVSPEPDAVRVEARA